MPGPGANNLSAIEFGKNIQGGAQKDFGIGRKETKETLTPGPGQYTLSTVHTKQVVTGSGMGKIGTQKRTDIWGTDKKTGEE